MPEITRSYRTYSIPGKTAALVPEFAVEDLPSAELQPWFLCLQSRTCPWVEHSDNDDSLINAFYTIRFRTNFSLNQSTSVNFPYNYIYSNYVRYYENAAITEDLTFISLLRIEQEDRRCDRRCNVVSSHPGFDFWLHKFLG